MQMRQRDVAALSLHHEELADAKAENDALRDDVAAGRRQFAQNSLPDLREAAPPPAWIMQPPPDWRTAAERDYFTLREG